MSLSGRSELATIHSSGYSITNAAAISRVCRSTETSRERLLRAGYREPAVYSGGGASTGRATEASVVIENPEFRDPEVDRREHRDDQQQQPGQGRGVAH